MITSVWLGPAVLAALVCGYRIDSIGLWWDELTTYDVSRRSVSQILHTLGRSDAVHGADYLFMHFWMAAFGTSLISLRMPDLLASIGTAVVTALTAKRLAGPRAGLVAGLVIALMPSVAKYATEVRSYPIVVLAAAASTLLLVRALERPGGAGRWAGYAAALMVAGLFNVLALTILAGHAVGVAVYAATKRPGPGPRPGGGRPGPGPVRRRGPQPQPWR